LSARIDYQPQGVRDRGSGDDLDGTLAVVVSSVEPLLP
jgi:hypothetical protein